MRVRFFGGALLASVAAGPIVLTPFAVIGLLPSRPEITASEIQYLPLILMLGTAFGFVVSFVPNMVGAGLLACAGTRSRAARHWIVWAVAGFALGSLVGAVMFQRLVAANTALGGVGMLCAIICRWRTRWIDEADDVDCPTATPCVMDGSA